MNIQLTLLYQFIERNHKNYKNQKIPYLCKRTLNPLSYQLIMKYLRTIFICFCGMYSLLLQAQVLYTENFDTADETTPPNAWTSSIMDGADPTENWRFDNPANRDIPTPINGTFAIFDSDYYGAGSQMENAILTSPIFNLENATEAILEFDQQFRAWEDSYGTVEVLIDDVWIEVYNTGNTDIGYNSNANVNSSETTAVDLTVLVAGNNAVQIRFRYAGNWAYWWAIDNVQILGGESDWDIEAVELFWESSPFCVNEEENLYIQILNNSNQVIKFSDYNVPITLEISAMINETIEVVLTEGLLEVGQSAAFLLVENISLENAGMYDFIADVNFPEDVFTANDFTNLSTVVEANSVLPLEVDFLDYNGVNLAELSSGWEEYKGVIPFENKNSAWTNATFANLPNNSQAAKINLFDNTKDEWLISPRFLCDAQTALSFDIAITQSGLNATSNLGNDDIIEIVVFDDCDNFTTLQTFDKETNLAIEGESFLHILEPYAGQNIRIGIFASEGSIDNSEDVDVFIDNIEVRNLFANDLAFVENEEFANQNCFSATTIIPITIINNGTEPIDFSTVDVDVVLQINGPNPYLFTLPILNEVLLTGESLTFESTAIDLSAQGEYELNLSINWAADENNLNDGLSIDFENTSFDFPSDFLSFAPYNGSNLSNVYTGWSEGTGFNQPTGNTSTWTVAYFGNDTTALNGLSAKVTLMDNDAQAWLLSPPYTIEENTALQYDLAVAQAYENTPIINTATDRFYVMVSTDCGESFTSFVYHPIDGNLGIEGTSFLQPLNAYIGQQIIVGFYVSEGPDTEPLDIDLFIDNIQLVTLPNFDISLQEIVQPQALDCFGMNEAIEVVITNKGSQDINFANENISIDLSIVGDEPIMLNQSISTGTLASQENMNIVFDETIDLSESAIYQLTFTLNWSEDENENNNQTTDNRVYLKPDYTILDGVDFFNYTGENLQFYNPRWREAIGENQPELFTPQSDWVDDFFANDPMHVNGTSARINLWKNDKNAWLVGPRILVADSTILWYDIALCNWGSNEATQLGVDDFLKVMISTDCGASYFPLKTYDANSIISATGENDSIDLSIYNDQEIIFAFYASEGTIDDDKDVEVFIDNIFIEGLDVPFGDVGAVELVSPSESICEDSTAFVTVRIYNYSENKQINIEVTTIISGTFNDTLVKTVAEIQPFASAYVYYEEVNTWGGATLDFTMITNLADDTNASNDALVQQVNAYPYPEVHIEDSLFACGQIELVPEFLGEYDEIKWDIGTTGEVVTTSASGTYIVTVGLNDCKDKDTTQVEIRPYPEALFIPLVDTISVNVENLSSNAQAYIWDFGDGNTSMEPMPENYIYADSGAYTMSLIAIDSICGNDTIFQNIITSLPIDSTDTISALLNTLPLSDDLKIYPNPTKNIFFINVENAFIQQGQLNIYNSQAQKIIDKQIFISELKGEKGISINNLNTGIYWIEIIGDNKRWLQKIIVL